MTPKKSKPPKAKPDPFKVSIRLDYSYASKGRDGGGSVYSEVGAEAFRMLKHHPSVRQTGVRIDRVLLVVMGDRPGEDEIVGRLLPIDPAASRESERVK